MTRPGDDLSVRSVAAHFSGLCPKSSITVIPPALVPITSNRRASPAKRSEEHTSELQSLMRISYAVFCLKKKKTQLNLTNVRRNIDNKHSDMKTTYSLYY